MTRTHKVRSHSFKNQDSDPMTVDLMNYAEWIATNPNGFKALSKEQLSPKELEITGFDFFEQRCGIMFAHPEQLEHALVMYGEGSYPELGSETALEHNERTFQRSAGDSGSMLFSLMARSGDMREFVSDRITTEVQDKWKKVQKTRKKEASERVHFSFDYDGAGHFHKSNGVVTITKSGLELRLSAAYVGDKVEDELASAIGAKRGLRGAKISVPINQTERDGYFFVDVKAVCEKLGIPVTDEDITRYLHEFSGRTGLDRLSFGYHDNQPTIWQDEATGVTVDLEVNRYDYDTIANLDKYFGYGDTSLWGPLPKETRKNRIDDKNIPRLRISVIPAGDPFAPETTAKSDEIIRDYMSRLEQAIK